MREPQMLSAAHTTAPAGHGDPLSPTPGIVATPGEQNATEEEHVHGTLPSGHTVENLREGSPIPIPTIEVLIMHDPKAFPIVRKLMKEPR